MTVSRFTSRYGLIIMSVLVVLLLAACKGATPTPVPTAIPTATPAPTATLAPTATPVPAPTPVPTATPVPPTATPVPPTPTPIPVVGIEPTPTAMPQPTPTAGSGQSGPPHGFIGSARLNGTPVAAGTEISALIDGIVVSTVFTRSGGEFNSPIMISGNVGKTVTFRIGNTAARQSYTIQRGGLDSVTLSN